MEEIRPGALPDPKDDRDYEAPLGGGVTVDWSKEFRLPEPPPFDQKSSDSCVACAWSYYHWQLKSKTFSKRDLFCRIALAYGAYIRDGGLALVKEGQADNKEVKDPLSPTPTNMRDKTGTKAEFRIDDQEFNSFTLPQQDIDGIAWGIKEYKGVVFGVNGTNTGWKDMKYPEPPSSYDQNVWGHALYAMGYHTCTNGEKCIIAKSSWSATNEHHIRRTYFTSGNTFSAWTLIPKNKDTMKLVKENGTVFITAGVNNKVKLGIADMETLALFGDEPVIDGVAEGTHSWTVSKGFILNKE